MSRSYTLIADMSRFLSPGHFVTQMSVAKDEDTFAFNITGPGPGYDEAGYLVYRKSTDPAAPVRAQSAVGINEVRLDKTGRYLFVNKNLPDPGGIEVQIVDLETGIVSDLTDGAPDHAPSHYDVGTGMAVGGANVLVGITARSLSTPHNYTQILNLANEGNGGGFHLSMLADNEGWTLVSFYTGHLLQGQGLQRELVQVATDGSQRVRRLAHHQSIYQGGETGYYDAPRANISRDGRFVAFTSNWGRIGANTTRHDLFIAEIPPAPPISASAAFVGVDRFTQGTWKGIYGAEGYSLVGDGQSLPAYAQVNVTGQATHTWAASTTDVRALQKAAAGSTDRIAAAWYSTTAFTIDVNLKDGQAHKIGLYCVDWDGKGTRSQRLEVRDGATNKLLNMQNLLGMTDGKYMVWNLRGHVKIKVIYTGPQGSNAVVSGLFFDPVTP